MSTTPSTSSNATTNNGVNSYQYTTPNGFRIQHIIVNNTNTFNANILCGNNNNSNGLGKLEQTQLINKNNIKNESHAHNKPPTPPACTKANQSGENVNQRVNVQVDSHVIDICINNVVCSYSTKCHLNLKRIATEGLHVEYKKENGVCIVFSPFFWFIVEKLLLL